MSSFLMVCSIQVGDNLNTSFGKLKVAVLCGGIGAEREISIRSGWCVADAIQKADLNVITVDIQPDELSILDDSSIDIFFLALHGEFGEDGQLQHILENKSVCYTGSGPEASRLAFDKMASKKVFAEAGVNVPDAIEFDSNLDEPQLIKQVQQLGQAFVVKPIRQGSSVGVRIVDKPRDAVITAQVTRDRFGRCMIEKFVPGREITVAILQRQTLPVIEVRSRTGFYDYSAKYIDERTEYLFDTIVDVSLIQRINEAAMKCFNALGCSDFARVDFILGDDGIPYALELNTLPGLTSHSLLPKAAAKAGLTMTELCVRIIEAAMEKKNAIVHR